MIQAAIRATSRAISKAECEIGEQQSTIARIYLGVINREGERTLHTQLHPMVTRIVQSQHW
jgi:hypothetical protein